MRIFLIEDNAGGLFIGYPLKWTEVTDVQNDSSFAEDAAALAAGNISNRNVDWHLSEPMGRIVARWDSRGLYVYEYYIGTAARNYLKAKEHS